MYSECFQSRFNEFGDFLGTSLNGLEEQKIHFPSKRLGVVSYTRVMHGFSDFISLHGLMDIPMKGSLYTCSNTSSTSRIDQFLFSPLLADHFLLFSQKKAI